jgi:serine/threonine-protein kinase HipA
MGYLMMTDLQALSRPLRQIEVYSGSGYAGKLTHERGSYNFTYSGSDSRPVSLTMQPEQRLSYNRSRLFTIFE